MTDTASSPPNQFPELLAPAGNWDCARAAVVSGADAIYFGLAEFNARLRADNFTKADLPELMAYLHAHGVRGFVTMNTLIFTDELDSASAQLQALEAAGVDAIIVQDLGLAYLAHQVAPGLALHASTQMTISSPEGLAFVEGLFPLERAVLARELSLKEIKRFPREGDMAVPLEVFVHGALCVAYSGQCLTSESLGQRSANRGECAQACRMPYTLVVDGEERDLGEVRYLLSPQDLAVVDRIPELIEAGVASFKIEGRLKSPEYVTAVTSVYRKAIDQALGRHTDSVDERDRYALEMTFSRGLSHGWLDGTNHPRLTHGRFGKKRGALLGEITRTGRGWFELKPSVAGDAVPLKAEDGIVFDCGEDRNEEQGGRIWKIDGQRIYLLRRSAVDWDTVQPGQQVWKTDDPALNRELRKRWKAADSTNTARHSLVIKVTGKVGTPLTLSCHGISVSSDQALEHASKRPLDTAFLEKQLGRLGSTDYALDHVENAIEGNVILPVSVLNALRRTLVERLDKHSLGPITAKGKANARPSLAELLPNRAAPLAAATELSVLCRSLPQVEAALSAGVSRLYCDFEDLRRYSDAVSIVRAHTSTSDASRIYLATPRIQKSGESGYFKLIERAAPDGVLLRNLGGISWFAAHSDLPVIGDFSLNVANPLTAQLLMQRGCFELLTVSYDLNVEQVLALLQAAPSEWFELTLHQHMPMFHMEHCVFCTFMSEGTSYKDCGRPCEKHAVQLKDRVGQLHPLHADVGCRNTLFNGRRPVRRSLRRCPVSERPTTIPNRVVRRECSGDL